MKTKRNTVLLIGSVFLLIALIFVGGMLFRRHLEKSELHSVTLIQLIATPEQYDGKRVRVIAVGNLEFEGDALYLGKEDLLYYTGNRVWLDFLDNTAIPYEQSKQFNGKYVLVEGTFQKDTWRDFHGSITDITRYDLWRTEGEVVTE